MSQYPIKPELQVSGKLSDNERLKAESEHLRGSIKQDLSDEITGGFNGDNFMRSRYSG
jgi:sulfite reductase (NADPH) hemoprotein beta-component